MGRWPKTFVIPSLWRWLFLALVAHSGLWLRFAARPPTSSPSAPCQCQGNGKPCTTSSLDETPLDPRAGMSVKPPVGHCQGKAGSRHRGKGRAIGRGQQGLQWGSCWGTIAHPEHTLPCAVSEQWGHGTMYRATGLGWCTDRTQTWAMKPLPRGDRKEGDKQGINGRFLCYAGMIGGKAVLT